MLLLTSAACRRPLRWHSLLQRPVRAASSVALQSGPALQYGVENSETALMHQSSSLGRADLPRVPQMKSSELRRLSEAAATERAPPVIWTAIAERSQVLAEQLHYWDAVHILKSFTAARVANETLFLHLADVLSMKTSLLAPKHVLDIFAVFEANDLRPRLLYVELFHTLVRLSRAMYAEEVSHTLQALARHQLGNPTVLAHLVRAVRRRLKEFRLCYVCGVAGALGSLEACPTSVQADLDSQARFEVDTMAPQEMLDNILAFPRLEYSWQPYEELCLQQFVKSINGFKSAEDVDQLAQPFEVLSFLQSRGLVHADFLLALCQWSLQGVHRPNVLSERRPTAKQLVLLYDHCCEWNVASAPALQDAIQYYVESAGGRWPVKNPQPLQYKKRRRYIRAPDPLEGLLPDLVTTASSLSTSTSAGKMDLFGLPTAEPEEAGGADDSAVTGSPSSGARKASMPASALEPGESTVRVWITSRKGPRPRHRRDPFLPASKRTNWPRPFVWMQGDWHSRPKYIRPGTDTPRPPHKGIHIDKTNGGRIHVK